ncbi:CurL C-terminal domain-containing protein, partial [Mycobacterium szulgai]|uniref:CurL C-terminal domain-containing protein n=1 Tax=Mycobacterium szulgai TaxID=1787 RepID=UPI003555DFFF
MSGAPLAAAEDVPAEVTPAPVLAGAGVVAWVVSAKTEAGVGAQAARLRSYLAEHPEAGVADVGFSLA